MATRKLKLSVQRSKHVGRPPPEYPEPIISPLSSELSRLGLTNGQQSGGDLEKSDWCSRLEDASLSGVKGKHSLSYCDLVNTIINFYSDTEQSRRQPEMAPRRPRVEQHEYFNCK